MTAEASPNRHFSKRQLVLGAILLAAISLGIYLAIRPQRAAGQAPLVDIRNIETLRTQFNRDAGQTRLIILVSPT